MKILVTGSSGFYGSHLIDLLLKETDAEIYGVDNLHRLEDFPVDPFEIIKDKEKFNERFGPRISRYVFSINRRNRS